MGTSRDIVVLDACVLYPAPLRDLLLSLASAGLYQARWTKMIETEWVAKLLANRPDIQPEALARTAQLMNQAIENSLIEDFESQINSFILSDPNDRHVVAAAAFGHATAIVTYNIKDFGQQSTIDIVHPDDFCTTLLLNDENAVLKAIQALRQRLRKPCKSAQQLIETYERQGLTKTSRILRGKIDLI